MLAKPATTSAVPLTLSRFLAANYADVHEVITKHFTNAVEIAASVGALLEEIPPLDGSRVYLANLDGQRDQRQYIRASITEDKDGTCWPLFTIGTYRHGGNTVVWKPRDLVWDEFQASKAGGSPREGHDRSGEYKSRSAELKAKAETRRAEVNEQVDHGYDAAARVARLAWEAADQDASTHGYPAVKKFNPAGLRVAVDIGQHELYSTQKGKWIQTAPVRAGELLIPMVDQHGVLKNLQRISATADEEGKYHKRSITGGRMKGCSFTFGSCDEAMADANGRKVIMIAEGVASAASPNEVMGYPSVVTFGASNMAEVARQKRKKYPAATLLLCADYDPKANGRNPGIEAAKSAAAEVGGAVAVPYLRVDSKAQADINDVYCIDGAHAVRVIIDAALTHPRTVVLAPDRQSALGVAYAMGALSPGDHLPSADGVAFAGRSPNDLVIRVYENDLAQHVDELCSRYPRAHFYILARTGEEKLAHDVAEAHGICVEELEEFEKGEHATWFDALMAAGDLHAEADIGARAQAEHAMERTRKVAADDVPVRNGYFYILGHDRGTYFIFKVATGQIHEITKRDLTELGLIELAPLNWWELNFSSRGRSESGGRMNKAMAAEFIIRTAEKRGIYDPDNVRGRGAWIDDGRIVYHHGNFLTVDGNRVGVSDIASKFVYPAARSLPEPYSERLTTAEGVDLLNLLRRFRWSVPGSALLFAGWIALAAVCGALPWRPHIWISGPAGCGKTTLASLANSLLLGTAVYAGGGSTEPGIRRQLGEDARPVLLDESEAKEESDVQRVRKLIGLIRQASSESGAVTLMGGGDGKSQRFNIRSMFCLASIMVATKDKADLDRLTTLTLRGAGSEDPGDVEWAKLRDMKHDLVDRDKTVAGRLLRRCIDLLPTTVENIKVFTDAAAERFGTQRQGDQFGTLLAGAWSLTSEEIATKQQALALIDSCDWSDHRDGAEEDDSRRAMNALLGGVVRMDSGPTHTLSDLIAMVSGRYISESGDELSMPKDARKKLGQFGMKVEDIRGHKYLFVGNDNAERDKVMAATPYKVGVKGLLLRLPGAVTGEKATGKKTTRFPGGNSQGFFVVPLDSVLVGDDSVSGSEPSF